MLVVFLIGIDDVGVADAVFEALVRCLEAFLLRPLLRLLAPSTPGATTAPASTTPLSRLSNAARFDD